MAKNKKSMLKVKHELYKDLDGELQKIDRYIQDYKLIQKEKLKFFASEFKLNTHSYKGHIPKINFFFSLRFLDFFIIAFKYVEMNILIRRHV